MYKENTMSTISRRDFLKVSAAAASTLMISTGLSGCGSDNTTANDGNRAEDETAKRIAVTFGHGVASGDPLQDKVIIWTRVTPVNQEDAQLEIPVAYEVATDPEFASVIHNGIYKTGAGMDFTVKIDLHNLDEGKKYYYRFKSGDTVSSTGIAKTLPSQKPQQVKFAVFTCANYPNGYFNAYTEAEKTDDLDATIHVGDYIYEYGMYKDDDPAKGSAYATQKANQIGRALPNDNNKECLTLEDYRKRYALYHTDKGTQAIHAACPMIAVWDDHEIANDAYKNGAENHDASEGDFSARTEAALQAYFEWLPIRPVTDKKEIFRSFDFGGLVALHMLETRIFGRDKQLSYADYYDAQGNFDTAKFMVDFTSTQRTILGKKQREWLQQQLQTSQATWQVLGQQVLMGRMNLPAELLQPIGMLDNPEAFGTTKDALMTQINTKLTELTQLKARALQNDPTLTDTDKARINTTLPYNLDAWDGYFADREIVLGTAKALQKNLVVFSGDTHNAWANNLKDIQGNQVGVEFATTSVTSPGLEEYLGLPDIPSSVQLEEALKILIDDLHYANTFDRGFMIVTFTDDKATSEWFYVDNYDSENYALNSARAHSVTVTAGAQPLKIS